VGEREGRTAYDGDGSGHYGGWFKYLGEKGEGSGEKDGAK